MIQGRREELKVYISGELLSPERSRKVYDHSEDFCWGYHGSGPSQFALGLLLDFGATDEEGRRWCQEFKRGIVAQLPDTDFELDEKVVEDWVEARRLFEGLGFGTEGNQGGE